MRRVSALGFLAAILAPVALHAQEAAEPEPERLVVLKDLATNLRVGPQTVDTKQIFRVYEVFQTNGAWLWIGTEDEDLKGWVRADDTVPLEQAIEFFTAEIGKNPRPQTLAMRGFVRQSRRELDLAIRDFTEAIRLDPRFIAAYRGRAETWSLRKDHERALADCMYAIRLDPKSAQSYLTRGNAWFLRGDFVRAIGDYEQAARLDPTFALARRGVATAKEAQRLEKEQQKLEVEVEDAKMQSELSRQALRKQLTEQASDAAKAGRFDLAVRDQTRALENSVGEKETTDASRRLASYKKNKPYQEPGEAK